MADRAEVKGRLVVIADDYEDALELLVMCFEEAGFVVFAAANGEEVLTFAATSVIDAFVLDLHMPVMDGWETIRRVREAYGSGPYVLAVSGHVSPMKEYAQADGADGVFKKPVDAQVLVNAVRAALDARTSHALAC